MADQVLLFLGSLQLSLKPVLHLVPLGFLNILVAWYLEGRFESVVNGGVGLPSCFMEPLDIVLHKSLVLRRQRRERQSLENFWDKARHRLHSL